MANTENNTPSEKLVPLFENGNAFIEENLGLGRFTFHMLCRMRDDAYAGLEMHQNHAGCAALLEKRIIMLEAAIVPYSDEFSRRAESSKWRQAKLAEE